VELGWGFDRALGKVLLKDLLQRLVSRWILWFGTLLCLWLVSDMQKQKLSRRKSDCSQPTKLTYESQS
jgi:hypothetical protein